MSAPLIRPASQADAPVLTALALASKAHWGYDDDELALWREELTISPGLITTRRVDCAVVERRIVGFCAVASDGEIAEIEHLWVDPDHIGHGIGAALFDNAAAAARAMGEREIRVVSDPNAVGFYIRMGATQVGEHESMPLGRRLPVLSLGL